MSDAAYLENDHLFTVYANAQLQESAENFYHVIDFLQKSGDLQLDLDERDIDIFLPDGIEKIEKTVSYVIEDFIRIIVDTGPDINQAIIKRGKKRSTVSDRNFFKYVGCAEDLYFAKGEHALTNLDLNKNLKKYEIEVDHDTEAAFEATYGYLDGYCWKPDENSPGFYEYACADANSILTNVGIDDSFFHGPKRLKCYECNQLGFIEVLNHIVDGVAFDEIPDLFELLNLANDWIVRRATTDKNGKLSFKRFWKNPYCSGGGGLKHGSDPEYPYKHAVNLFIMSVVANSLGVFLLNEKRERLHKCRVCGNFFIDHANATECPSPRDCRDVRKKVYSRKDMRERRDVKGPKFDVKYLGA